jgi:hypothetical protein
LFLAVDVQGFENRMHEAGICDRPGKHVARCDGRSQESGQGGASVDGQRAQAFQTPPARTETGLGTGFGTGLRQPEVL